jgi:hypothetical protein
MKKITKIPETAEEHLEDHRIFWREVVVVVKKRPNLDLDSIKSDVVDSVCGVKVAKYIKNGRCFACEWKRKHGTCECSYGCLLNVESEWPFECDCLNGDFSELYLAIKNKSWNEAIVLAEKIRDWPMNPKWEGK